VDLLRCFVLHRDDVNAFLDLTPATKLPFLGGKEQLLSEAGLVFASDVGRVPVGFISTLFHEGDRLQSEVPPSEVNLRWYVEEHCKVTEQRAAQLLAFGRGKDDRPVQEKVPFNIYPAAFK
jgi:hypothetical protein